MAAKRGKSQARRNSGGDSGLPGWAWMVLGILLAVVAILVAPKYFKSSGDGFFRPQPNPDAQPATASGADEEAIAQDAAPAPAKGKGKGAQDEAAKKDTDYDFYTLLPANEVALSDAELAETERAEAERQAKAAQAAARANDTTPPATDTTAQQTQPAQSTQVATATSPTTAKPDTVAFLSYIDEDGSQVSIIHVFADAAAMDRHFEGADERTVQAFQYLVPRGWEVYGQPSEAALQERTA